MGREDREKRRQAGTFGQASAIGIELAASVLGGLLVGWFADKKLGTSPWLTLVGLVAGSFSGFWALYRLMKRMQKDVEEEERKQ